MKVEKSSTIPSLREAGGLQEGESAAELSNTPPSPVSGSTLKDSCNTRTGENSDSQQSTSLLQETEERTTGPKETSAESLGQEGDVKEAEGGGIQSSSEQQTVCVASNVTKAEHTEKADSVRTLCSIVDQKTSPSTSHFKPIEQNAESESSVHSDTEENGLGPENRDSLQSIAHNGTVSDGPSKPVSPLPQVNGNDGLESDNIVSNSVMNLNNGVLTDRPKLNSIGKVEVQKLSVSLKDSTQQKPLVNGDLTPVNNRVVMKEKDPCLDSEVEERVTMSDQDYKPPVKLTRLDNNMGSVGSTLSPLQNNSTSAFNAVETKPTPVVKIIRMAPSPILSAEESSLSDDFAEENSNSGSTEQFKTIVTQVTTTSTTTTFISTEMRKVPLKASRELKHPVVTTESSAVSTLSTMTKTTVTKISSSALDSQSEDSQSEVVLQEQETTQSACIYESTTDTGGTTTTSVAVSQEDSSSTKGRVRLLKFSRTKKTRSDTALPSYRKFVTKSSRRSIFVLPHDDVKVLARRGGFREVPVFSYNAKPAQDIWPYPSPRPTFGITWR